MAYFLKKTNNKKGTYLQIYSSFYDPERRHTAHKAYKPIGYVHELQAKGIDDPISFYKEEVIRLNQEANAAKAAKKAKQISDDSPEKLIGYFPMKNINDKLSVKKYIDLMQTATDFRFNVFDMISALVYARLVQPCSKSKTYDEVIPKLFESYDFSLNQLYDGLEYIGCEYEKIIEIYNHQIQQMYQFDTSHTYFDCTNFYFEIDREDDFRKKGPSKENRHGPIIGQALLLDADLVPLAMQMYPGNESEKPYIRKIIQEMKERYKVAGKTVQVADKGLNCARNIYAAVVEARDGYIFSKSIHGKGLSEKEKQWILLENDANVYTDYRDKDGKLLFRLKSCVDTFSYKFRESDPETGKEKVISFQVKEKRIVSYNPSLAQKQKAEIMKMVDKATNYTTYKKMAREDLGDSVKYIKITNIDKNGKNRKPVIEINQAKIEEDLKYAGYNLLVTSELDMNPLQVYHAYHNLWKIEESFRITKSYLDARPVYVQKKETIYGHFLICYLSLFLLRILEIKCFKNEINSYDLVNFMRDFRVVNKGDGTYINISQNQRVNENIKKLIGLTNLDALYLTEKEIENIFEFTMLVDD